MLPALSVRVLIEQLLQQRIVAEQDYLRTIRLRGSGELRTDDLHQMKLMACIETGGDVIQDHKAGRASVEFGGSEEDRHGKCVSEVLGK